MNNVKFRIKNDSETWHIYDYDFTQESYVTGKLTIYKGIVKLKALQRRIYGGIQNMENLTVRVKANKDGNYKTVDFVAEMESD